MASDGGFPTQLRLRAQSITVATNYCNKNKKSLGGVGKKILAAAKKGRPSITLNISTEDRKVYEELAALRTGGFVVKQLFEEKGYVNPTSVVVSWIKDAARADDILEAQSEEEEDESEMEDEAGMEDEADEADEAEVLEEGEVLEEAESKGDDDDDEGDEGKTRRSSRRH